MIKISILLVYSLGSVYSCASLVDVVAMSVLCFLPDVVSLFGVLALAPGPGGLG